MPDLTDVERAMIAFERDNVWWKYSGTRETAILQTFDMPVAAYDRRLLALIHRPEALEADPLTINRLRDRVAGRQRSRSIRQMGP